MNRTRLKLSQALLCLVAFFGLAVDSFAACTLGTHTCCLGAGGAGDTAATRIVWEPNAGTSVWTTTNNWNPANVPNAATESAYIQADWFDPAFPAASYSLACVQIASGSMTATPAGSTVTVTIPSGTATVSIPSATATVSIPSGTATVSIPSSTVTMTIANPAVITWTGHGLALNEPVVFSTTGALPTGIVSGTTYYARNIAANTFRVAATPGGAALATSGSQSGTHTARKPGVVTFAGHGLAANTPVHFTTSGGLPTGLVSGTTYYVASIPAIAANTFAVSATPGGVAIITSGTQSGTHTLYRPGVVTLAGHGLAANTPVRFTTTGALPTGLVAGTTYYVASLPAIAANTFSLSTTAGGAAIRTSGSQSGTHTLYRPGVVTFAGHGLAANTPVRFTTTGALPTGLTAGTTYYVASVPAIAANTFSVAATPGGDAIGTSGTQSGTHTLYRPGVFTLAGHGFTAGTPVQFTTTGALPTGLTPGVTYYVTTPPAIAANTFSVAATPGGDAIATSGSQSGTHTLGARVLTVVGEYFENQNLGSLTTNSYFFINMAGTNPQTFDNVDPINNLVISNSTTVTMPSAFTVSSSLTINPGAGSILIGGGLTLSYTGTALTIPSSATVEVQNGAVLTAMGGIVVNGILKVNAGGSIKIGNGKTLQVNAGGVLQLQGSSGNVATLDADQGGSTYGLNVAGSINANYFSISRTTANGLYLTTAGTDSIQALANGDFHYVANGGNAITLATAKDLPSNPTGLGFYDDFSYGNINNIDATSYTGTAVTLNNWAGLGGATYETDPSNKIAWGTQAPVSLQITNRTASGSPGSTIAKASAATLFATYGFSLTGAGTASDITSVKLTLSGLNVPSDVAYIRVYGDANANCVYNAGVDSQIGTDLIPTGSPPTVTVSIPASTVTVSDTTQKCVHVVLATNVNAWTGDTLQVTVLGTSDVVNSQSYSFSNSSGPPVSGGVATITGTAIKKWGGGNGPAGGAQNWNANAGDWTPSGTPISSNDCQIGPAYSYPTMNASYTCTNVNLPAGGRMAWGGTANTLNVLGGLTVGSSYTFTTATTGNIAFNSTVATQSLSGSTAFPGNFIINNTYGGDGLVTVNSDFTVNGNLTITRGVLTVTSGENLTVLGNITINGGTLTVEPGATLTLGDGKTLTVGASGTFRLVGSVAQAANFTCSGTTTGCAIAVTGTIAAQYYSMNRLAVSGLTINSGATIDATDHLQNGSLTYPIGTNPILMSLNRKVPTDTLAGMTFDMAGSSATGAKSILTNTTAGTLVVSSYSGDLTNCCTTAPTYLVSWMSPTTTLKLTLESSAPTTVNQGDTGITLGRFGLQQTQAGTYNNTDITSLNLTLQGSQNASDITNARLYYDSGCTGTGGVQVGTAQVFSGSPPTATFSGLSGATVESSITSPPKRCLYVQVDVASGAGVGNQIGVDILANGDVVNSEGYLFNGSYSPPVSAGTSIVNGTTITWTGTTSTAWMTTSNWNLARIPTSADNCIINSAGNDPVISVAGAVCKSLTIGNGNLTINTGQNLDLYGSYTNTGTFTASGTATLTIRDNGITPTNQTLQSSTALSGIVFNKTASGYVYLGNQALTINNFAIAAGKTFSFNVRNGDTLTLPNGATLSSATFQVDDGGTVKIGNGQTFLVNGGVLYTVGTNDGYPQSSTNKAVFTIDGSGTWGFNSTSGQLILTGFIFDYLNTSGLVVGGTTDLAKFEGGQFTNLSNTYASVKAFQLNSSGSLPTGGVADYIGFNWGPNNTPPSVGDGYKLAYSSGCASHTLSFTNWFGDFFVAVNQPVTSTKISTTSCTINMAAAASPVGLTEFKATPYDATVLVDWSTGLEIMHQGFNVYRSSSPDAGFVQINGSLLRNPSATGTVHGHYQFYDRSVVNGSTYYYKLEDIAANGKRTLHGPLSATPDASFGTAPAPASGAISANDQLPAPTPDPGQPDTLVGGSVVLAPGVTLLTKTKHSRRIKIDVPAFTTSASDLVPYQRVAIPGYASTTVANRPELPERVILIEVPAAESAVFREIRRTSSIFTSLDIAPARAWTVISGNLVPSDLAVDSAFYAIDQARPNAVIELGEIVQNQGLSYLPVIVRPLSYNPVQRTVDGTSQIVVDITLAGVPDWNVGSALTDSGPWGYEGALKIHLKRAGLYQISYGDLANLGIEGPFAGADVTKLRLFHRNGELPLEVDSPSGYFADGDTLRFFAPYSESPTSDRNTLVMVVDRVAGLRMETISSPVNGTASTQASFDRRIQVKTPSFGFFNEALGEGLDHIFWGRIYSPPVTPGEDLISANVLLPNLANSGTVHLKAYVKGSPGVQVQNPTHHVRLFVNGSSISSGNQIFAGNEPRVLGFDVPVSSFTTGLNQIQLQAMGDYVVGDYDFINLEKIVVDYPHAWVAESGVADILNYQAGSTLTVSGFPSEPIQIYDITDTTQTAVLADFSVIDNGADGYEVNFSTTSGDPSLGRRFSVVANSAVLSPWSLELNHGSNLRSATQGADVIYLGPKALLDGVAPLADLRRTQGFRVAQINVEDVYLEFGKGIRGPEAVKDFVAYAYAHWQAPAPKYLILVGDGTFDPKNQLDYGDISGVPVHLSQGQFVDFGNDNWFVDLDGTGTPALAVGRIPGRTRGLVTAYAAKVLDYEAGARRPTGSAASKFILASDSDQVGGEQFDERSDKLAASLAVSNSNLRISRLSRQTLGDAGLKQGLINAFNNGATMIHYVGHGAEDRWAAGSVFQNSDADSLANTTLPVVVAMNCLNGYYYDADATYESLADRFLFNKNGGAIAVWASTSLTSPDIQTPFQTALYQVISENSGIRLGDAIRLAKIAGGVSEGTAEVIGSWTLFGDPMVELKIPAPPQVFGIVNTPNGTATAVAADEAADEGGGSCMAVHQPSSRASRPGIGSLILMLGLCLSGWVGRIYRTRRAAVRPSDNN